MASYSSGDIDLSQVSSSYVTSGVLLLEDDRLTAPA